MDFLSDVPPDLSQVDESFEDEFDADGGDDTLRPKLQVPPTYEPEDDEALPAVLFEESAGPSEGGDCSEEISEEQLDRLAELDFEMPDVSEPKDTLEQTELPDPEEEEDPIPEIPMSSPYEESTQITAGGDKPLHKRSIPKVAIGVGCAVLIASIGSMVSSGGSTQTASEDVIGQAPESPLPGSAPESDAGELQAQLTSNELEAEINARQAAKEQQAKAAKEAADQARRNQMIGATTSPSAPATPPRIVYPQRSMRSAVPTPNYSNRSSAPRVSSNRVVTPRIPVRSQVPPVQPKAIAPPATLSPEQEAPQMLAFGSMPGSNTESDYSPSFGAQPALQGQNTTAFEQPTSTLVAQQEAFLAGRRQTQIKAGQTINARIEGQYLAEPDTEFIVRTTSAVLGLQAGSLLRAKVIGMSGKYVGAEVISMISPSGFESPVPPGAMTVSSSSGKLLKASSNKGFFQSAVGKGLLGFGRGAADQFISRTESFSSNQFGSSFTRGSGSKDLTSVLGSGLRGFADPILQNPGSGQSALTLNPGAVTLNINASFSIAQ